MNPQLELRIREVYPSGKLSEPNEDAFYGSGYADKVESAVNSALTRSGIRCDGDQAFGADPHYDFPFTSKSGPEFGKWVGWNNSRQLSWIEKNASFYPVLWARVSRVYPTAFSYYNIWQPRGSAGYVDAVISETPCNPKWAEFEMRLSNEFERVGIHPLDELNKLEKTWVTDEEYSDDNGNDLPDDEVRLVQCNIWTCLFPQ